MRSPLMLRADPLKHLPQIHGRTHADPVEGLVEPARRPAPWRRAPAWAAARRAGRRVSPPNRSRRRPRGDLRLGVREDHRGIADRASRRHGGDDEARLAAAAEAGSVGHVDRRNGRERTGRSGCPAACLRCLGSRRRSCRGLAGCGRPPGDPGTCGVRGATAAGRWRARQFSSRARHGLKHHAACTKRRDVVRGSDLPKPASRGDGGARRPPRDARAPASPGRRRPGRSARTS